MKYGIGFLWYGNFLGGRDVAHPTTSSDLQHMHVDMHRRPDAILDKKDMLRLAAQRTAGLRA